MQIEKSQLEGTCKQIMPETSFVGFDWGFDCISS